VIVHDFINRALKEQPVVDAARFCGATGRSC
jgi:hypothetical protein